MTTADRARLEAECRVFAAYLAARPDDYVLEKYAEAHARTRHFEALSRFDRLLVRLASLGTLAARLADSYACLAARRSALRRKLILLVGILESLPPERGLREEVDSRSRLLLAVLLAARGLLFAVCLALALAPLALLHFALGGIAPAAEQAGGRP
jgi:hypothetical protein